MRGSWKIGRLAGIDVFMHWTFLLLLGWIAFIYLAQGESLAAALTGVGFVIAIFGCVVLHELGHALTARRFGVPTRDITLLPIGGVARLQRIPERPIQEFLVAIAGPAVNVVIAAGLFVLLLALFGIEGILANMQNMAPETIVGGPFLVNLMAVNLLLVVFNVLPAFPMDGGRILRAALASQMDYVKATRIAARIGQGMAVLFAIAGLFGNPFLLLIAVFVFLGAAGELQMVVFRAGTSGVTAKQAMMTRLRTLRATDTLSQAADALLEGSEHEFPVVDESGRLVGILGREALVEALQESNSHDVVTSVMSQQFPVVSADDDLREIVVRMREEPGTTAVPVVEGDRLVGLITMDNIQEMMAIRTALEDRCAAAEQAQQLVKQG